MQSNLKAQRRQRMQPLTFASCCVSPQFGQTVVDSVSAGAAAGRGRAGSGRGVNPVPIPQHTTAVPLTLTISMPLFWPRTS